MLSIINAFHKDLILFVFRPERVKIIAVIACCAVFVSPAVADDENKIDFSSQVRPILSDRCFHCHGPDAENQDSTFRMDSEEELFVAVEPSDLESSELYLRIFSDDPDAVMPPPASKRSLSDEEKQTIKLWIQQGAPYEGHWAFEVPQRPEVPKLAASNRSDQAGWAREQLAQWSKNPIDAFIGQRLIEESLTPSPPTDPHTLLRRASLTLTGLLPDRDLQEQFESNAAVDSQYDSAIETLLGSTGYAERQALRWLDAARYADTDGYQNDLGRTNWPWRDWVIKAFRDNMPFDQFTIEQIAGDMLPNASVSQKIASAFNRNHRQNAEGGALAAEFRVENVIDRVETTSTVFLGLTFGCARCHDHKYDPLSQREFFQLYGYFNNIGEKGIGRGIAANPTMKVISPLLEIDDKWLQAVEQAEQKLASIEPEFKKRLASWIRDQEKALKVFDKKAANTKSNWSLASIAAAQLDGDGKLTVSDDQLISYSDGNEAVNVTYRIRLAPFQRKALTRIKLQALPDARFGNPVKLADSVNGNFLLTDCKILLNEKLVDISRIQASFEQNGNPASAAIDGKPTTGWGVFQQRSNGKAKDAQLVLANPLQVTTNDTIEVALTFGSRHAGHSIGKLKLYLSEQAASHDDFVAKFDSKQRAALRKPGKKRTKDDKETLRAKFESIDPEFSRHTTALRKAQKDLQAQGANRATLMVMRERAGDPEPTYLLDRGQYDAPIKKDPLPRGVPKALLQEDSDHPTDRLELAKWLVSRDNPLTARVIVNRIWQEHFGIGLVKTVDDFGVQGEPPSHPELLDWLAIEFIESGWDVKAIHRLLVTSQAYKQSSKSDPDLFSQDPENRLLARGPRYRADGFSIRDIALQASGLLHDQPGGPAVKPYQPGGLWEVVAANAGTRYKVDRGQNLYRKSMYTYWKRAVNPPRQTIFDAGGREVCNVQVRRTNTPLQALVMLNDPTFVESARVLAQQVLKQNPESDEQAVAELYRRAIARPIDAARVTLLEETLALFRQHFKEHSDEASELLAIGEAKADKSLDATEHAAMTAVAHVILNTDEFITVE